MAENGKTVRIARRFSTREQLHNLRGPTTKSGKDRLSLISGLPIQRSIRRTFDANGACMDTGFCPMPRQIAAFLRASTVGLLAVPGTAWAFQPPIWAGQAFCRTPVPVMSTTTSFNPVAKSEAILGARSKLDEMRAQQVQARRPLAISTTPMLIQTSFSKRLEPGAGPASAPCISAPNFAFRTEAAATPLGTGVLPLAIDTGKPDVFGSIALQVSHTPLDGKWHKVRNGRLSVRSGPWAAILRDTQGLARPAQLEAINHWVNARISFADDATRFHIADRWADAAQTLAQGRGDCEDYAIAKMKLLEAAGVSRRDLYLVIARDLVRRADHALLVVRSEGRLVVLDSNTDRIVDSLAAQDYRPVMSYSGDNAWIHGYPTSPQTSPIQMASIAR
jgi:predicted transglutaminase-like cysteine proteinase